MNESLIQDLKSLLVRELDLRGRTAEDLLTEAPLFGPESLGLDSLDALQIAVAVEERFAIRLPEGAEARPVFRSIATLAAYIEEARAKASPAPC